MFNESNTIKYFLYCRKSTDEDNRQVQSIDSQIEEAKAFAIKENLNIVRTFVESKTAKEPGREVFNQMLDLIEKGDAEGIIAWHPDRLARNSVDGGRVIYLMDKGLIKDLRFPTYWIDNTPQGKFSLSLAFGQSKYYVDNLSQNVKRGLRAKIKKGEWPTQAILGYMNKDKKIVPDPKVFPIVQKLFFEYGTGLYSMVEIRERSFQWGLRSKKGKMLSKSMIQNTLKNPFYAGIMVYNGERHEGNHKAIVNIGKFLQIQKVMKNKGKPTRLKREAPAYRGILTCGICGCSITSEIQKGHIYYRCTKKKGPCDQPYIREEDLDTQLSNILKQISIDDETRDAILIGLSHLNKQEFGTYQNSLEYWQKEFNRIEERKSKLVDLYTMGDIDKEEYETRKGVLLAERKTAKDSLDLCEKSGDQWLEQFEGLVIVANMAHLVFDQGDFIDKREILLSIGSNFTINHKKLDFSWIEPFNLLAGNTTSTTWLPGMDSNHNKQLQRLLSYH